MGKYQVNDLLEFLRMVKLYTWMPAPPDLVLEREVGPDLGHCAIEIVDHAGRAVLYASFWPERDSLPGRLTDILKHRVSRQPASYRQEASPDEHFMQRPADFVDIVAGLNEARMIALWPRVRNSRYNFRDWNCSSVAKHLLLSGMGKRARRIAENASGCGISDPRRPRRPVGLLNRLRSIATSQVVACAPEDVRRMVEAYNAAQRRRGVRWMYRTTPR